MTKLQSLLASLRASVGRDSASTAELLQLAEIVAEMQTDPYQDAWEIDKATSERDTAIQTLARTERVLETVVAERDVAREHQQAAERELERWRHNTMIEGDYVCPDTLQRDALESQVYKQTETIERLLGELESVTRERDELRDGFESFKTGQAAFASRLTNERDAARAELAGMRVNLEHLVDNAGPDSCADLVTRLTADRDAARASLAATEAALADSREKAQSWHEQYLASNAMNKTLVAERDAFAKEVRDVRVVVERETVEEVATWLCSDDPPDAAHDHGCFLDAAARALRTGEWRKP